MLLPISMHKCWKDFHVTCVEVESSTRSYYTRLITTEDTEDSKKVDKAKDGCLLKGQIYTLKVPQVDGGSKLSMKVTWSQKLLYHDDQFCLHVPFSFPAHVIPVGKKISKREKILLNVNSGTGTELLCKTTSHPLRELRRKVGKLSYLYEAEVSTWSITDFNFSFTVYSGNMFGRLLLQSPSLHDIDQREMFCFYLFPGLNKSPKVFKKEMVFIVDVSGSMRGVPLENAKNALSAALSMLNPEDSFNIIAFNENTRLFSSSMELASKVTIENAMQWINTNLIADGVTNILLPLNQAIEMVAKTSDAVPFIFLITDGAVEDERHIYNVMKGHLINRGSICPRICTFGIGSYCNHYFLQMLAQIGRGLYDAAYDVDSINSRMQRLFNTASSVLLANVTIDALEQVDSVELFPFHIPDLSSESPLIVSGRYHGNFPDSIKASGILADMSNFTVNVKVQKVKDMPLDKVFARRQIDLLTAQAWLLESKLVEEKVAKMSIQTGIPSEYTSMILVQSLQTDKGKQGSESIMMQENKTAELTKKEIIYLRKLGLGFGNLIATAENRPPGIEEVKLHETSETVMTAASSCCSWMLDHFCCMCFIQACSRMNDQCAIALTQLCTALACFECLNCCCEVCDGCDQCC